MPLMRSMTSDADSTGLSLLPCFILEILSLLLSQCHWLELQTESLKWRILDATRH
jgi:hypothetical protein